MTDTELRQEILKAVKKGWVSYGDFRTDEAVDQVFKMAKEKLIIPSVSKSFFCLDNSIGQLKCEKQCLSCENEKID